MSAGDTPKRPAVASNVLTVGISGPSSSGKTTLARLLRECLPHAFILHQDDFFRPEAEIPMTAGNRNWDCVGALDLHNFADALDKVRRTGAPPTSLASKEDKNTAGPSNVSAAVIERCKAELLLTGVAPALQDVDRPSVVCIVDGFLMYAPKEVRKAVIDKFDVRIFLPARREVVLERRGKRSGYVTLEGFWEDPEGYVEDVVWPSYAQDHAGLFVNGNVEGEVTSEAREDLKLDVWQGGMRGQNMEECLVWAVEILKKQLMLKTEKL